MMDYLLICAAFFAAQFTAAAAATPDVKRRDVAVEFSDLDLSTPQGIAVFDRRLAAAVVKACGTAHYLEPQQLNDMERCREAARARAVAVRDTILGTHDRGAGVAARTSK